MDMRAVAGLLCALLASACQLEVTYEGARFTCAAPTDTCPEGTACVSGECVPPLVDPVDAGVDDPADAEPRLADADPSGGPADAAPEDVDASPAFETRTITLGERSGADLRNVSRDTYITDAFPNENRAGDPELATDSS